LSAAGWTTTVLKMDLPALVRESDSIVQGYVARTEAQWDEKAKIVFTSVYITVRERLKGDPEPYVLVRQIGGKVGTMNLSVIGMPTFSAGEEVILFLKRNAQASYHVVGLSQGKYAISDGWAFANNSGVELMDRTKGRLTESSVMTKEQLDNFKSRIRQLVK
jgi:hypothetical protein